MRGKKLDMFIILIFFCKFLGKFSQKNQVLFRNVSPFNESLQVQLILYREIVEFLGRSSCEKCGGANIFATDFFNKYGILASGFMEAFKVIYSCNEKWNKNVIAL